MTPHKEGQQPSMLELSYNKKHKRGQLILKNAFSILKNKNELKKKVNFHIILVLDVLITCWHSNTLTFALVGGSIRLWKVEFAIHHLLTLKWMCE